MADNSQQITEEVARPDADRGLPGIGKVAWAEVLSQLKGNSLLVVGGLLWWGSHYLLLWNSGVAAQESVVAGYDVRFLLTVLGTVVALGAISLYAAKHPSDHLCGHGLSYLLYVLLAGVSLVMIALPTFLPDCLLVGAVGAVISGLGNSFALVLYGELHARANLRLMPLFCVIEISGGILVFLLVTLLLSQVALIVAVPLVVGVAVCWRAYDRKAPAFRRQSSCAKVDLGLKTLLLFAVLTGLSYGLMRTFTFAPSDSAFPLTGFSAECLGTCFSLVLLLAVFLLQKRLSLFDICLLFVVPLVATGLLLVSIQKSLAAVPAILNQGGFACFFVLMWYFAAELSSLQDFRFLTRNVSLLFLTSQFGQLVGSCVPQRFSNELVNGLVYLILIASMLLLYWRSKRAEARRAGEGGSDGQPALSAEPDVRTDGWAQRYGLSPREVEITVLLSKRTPYRQISEGLFISENTVKTHVRNIYKKFGVSSREELLEVLESLDGLAKKG